MERTNVKSTDLSSIGYDELNLILEIEFNSGGVYRYFAVPKEIFDSLMSASSHGKFFNANIKNRFKYDKVC